MYMINAFDVSTGIQVRIANKLCLIQNVVREFDYNKLAYDLYTGGLRVDTDEADALRIADAVARAQPKTTVYISKVCAIVKAKTPEVVRQTVTDAGVLPA